MTITCLLVALPLTLLLPQDDAERQVRGLVEKLRSENIEEREKAAAKLRGLGKVALPELEKAIKDLDAEVATRVRRLIYIITLPTSHSHTDKELAEATDRPSGPLYSKVRHALDLLQRDFQVYDRDAGAVSIKVTSDSQHYLLSISLPVKLPQNERLVPRNVTYHTCFIPKLSRLGLHRKERAAGAKTSSDKLLLAGFHGVKLFIKQDDGSFTQVSQSMTLTDQESESDLHLRVHVSIEDTSGKYKYVTRTLWVPAEKQSIPKRK